MLTFTEKLTGRPASEFGTKLAEKFSLFLPQKTVQDGNISRKQLDNVLAHILGEAREYSFSNELGLVNRSRLTNAFRWKLKEYGYKKELIEAAVYDVIIATQKTKEKN